MTIRRIKKRCMGMDSTQSLSRHLNVFPSPSSCLSKSDSAYTQPSYKTIISRITWKHSKDGVKDQNRSLTDRMHSWKRSIARSRARPLPPLKSLWTTSRYQDSESETSSKENRFDSYSSSSSSPSIFEEFIVIGIDLSTIDLNSINDSHRTVELSPKILFKFNSNNHLSLGEALIMSFVCPSGQVKVSLECNNLIESTNDGRNPIQHDYIWSSQLTTSSKDLVQIFGVCLSQSELITMIDPRSGRQYRLRADTYYCLTTRYPALDTLSSLIKVLIASKSEHPAWISGPNLGRTLRNQWDHSHVVHMLQQIGQTPIPNPDFHFTLNFDLGCIQSRRPSSDILWIRSWAVRRVLRQSMRYIGSAMIAKTLLALIEIVLRENSLVIIGEDLGLTSSWVLFLISAIYPLQWAGICFPLLPDRWEDFLQSPVPIIAAVRNIPEYDDSQTDLVQWRSDRNQITSKKKYVLTEPARRCAKTIESLLPSVEIDPTMTDRVIDVLSEYVIDIIQRVESDPDPIYDQYQQTQIWSHYLYTRDNR